MTRAYSLQLCQNGPEISYGPLPYLIINYLDVIEVTWFIY